MSQEADFPPVAGDDLETSLDAELGRVLEAYLADLEAGRPDDRERLLAEHPAIARQLRACLQVMNLADRMVDASGSGSRARRVMPRLDSTTTPPGQSVLTSLGSSFGSGAAPRVQLRDLPDEPEPLIRPRSAEMPAQDGSSLGRYQVQGEIARGGMGAILKGRDVDLGRELALKVLLESHQGNPEVVSRFIEEAQIGGQLQHPGIAPVYELGTFPAPDLRPYFAMKLVKGQTLAALLADQPVSVGAGSVRRSGPDRGTEAPPTGHPRPVRDLPRFLSIFEAVCQTMAYAHARGVIHRDLKPSNIMVGSFGEVQVMDWGLAKVLPRGGIADEAAAQPARETVIMTVRSGSAGSGGESQAGSVLGTPAYMAPEQARGEIDRIDERADVFGLGAILCEILTGRPPFAGATREEIRAQSARGDLAGALGRLDACGAEAELIELARDCLAPEPARRPRNAGHVSRRMKAFLTGLQERLRTAELARVEAQARAVEEAKRAKVERDRRRLTVGLAASLLALMTIGGLSVAYLLHQEQARAARVERLLARAGFLRDEARARPEDTAAWEKARDALDQVEVAPDARARLVALIAEVQTGLAGAERLATLRQALVDIRSSQQDAGDEATDLAYAGAFRAVDLDLDALSPADAAAPIRRHSPPIVVEVATALDHWSEVRRRSRRPVESWRRPLAVARLADRDPYRDRLRGLIAAADLKAHAAELQALAGAPDATDLPAATALVLAGALVRAGAAEAAIATLRRAAARHPEDVWLSWNLAGTLANARTPRREEALGYYRAARSLRPETAHELAHYLEKMGQRDEAETVFRDLIRRRPGDPKHLGCYGKHLHERGRRDEARLLLERAVAAGREAVGRTPMEHHVVLSVGVALEALGRLDDAVAAYREAIRIERGYAVAHHNLGCTLGRQGKLEEAVAQFREAIQLNPDLADPHRELGAILCDDRHDYDGAIAEFRTAIRLKPDDEAAHCNLGVALNAQGKHEEAIAEYRNAMRLKPEYADAHNNLGAALKDQGKLELAEAEYREAIRLKPDYADAHYNLGVALHHRKLDEAIAEYREAIRLNPDLGHAHDGLGTALRDQRKLDEAIAEYRTAVRVEPGYANAHSNLGYALGRKGKLEEAVAQFREAIQLNPDLADPHRELGAILCDDRRDYDGAIAEFRTAIRLKPDDEAAHCNLGVALNAQGKHEEAIAEYRNAMRLKPDYADAHNNLGTALKDKGKLELAEAEYREAIRLKPDYADAHCNLGTALHHQRKLDEEIAEYREAIRLKPDLELAHNNLGTALREHGKLDEAIAEYRAAIRLDRDFAVAHTNLGDALREQGKLDEAVLECREAIRLKPDLAMAHLNLGNAVHDQGRLDEAIAEYRSAMRLEPDCAEARNNLGLVFSKQGRLDEAVAEYRTAIRLRPNCPEAHTNLGTALTNQRKLYEAVAEFREAIRLKPDDGQTHSNLGGALAMQGRLDEAITELRTAIRLEPADSSAHNNPGLALKERGKLDEAMIEFRTVIRLKPDHIDAHASLGAILCDVMHDYDGAINEFRAAVRLEPDNAVVHSNLGTALSGQGKPDEAIAEHRESIRLKPDYPEATAIWAICSAKKAISPRHLRNSGEVTSWARRTRIGVTPPRSGCARRSVYSSLTERCFRS